ncbi:calcium-binding protein, partial [Magnetovibrio sp.]|uniref:calcium-binding protein n=1 Tax=Magnetovibrio sp. TaxID=2024836 RepID=UPI002F954730
DHITGTTGADTISTGLGDDIVIGGDGYDIIDGGDGNDTLSSNQHGSELTGGLGTNSLTGSIYLTLNDVVQIDTAVYAGTQADYTITQNADYTYTIAGAGVNDTLTYMDQLKFLNNGGTATFYQLGRQTTLHGTGSTASGGDGKDHITGTAGSDTISTGLGDDIVIGGAGNDIINGGAGADTMTGGTGTDIFRYDSISNSSVGAGDAITDFNALGEDVIQLQGMLTGAWDGTVAAFTGTAATFANTGNTQIAFNDTSKLLQIDVNGNGAADMEITLSGVAIADLDATDFTIT